MTQLLLFNVTNGLIIGAFYVLMALGLSLILNLSNVINFAHGGFLVIGGYIAYSVTPYVGFWGALPGPPAADCADRPRRRACLDSAALRARSTLQSVAYLRPCLHDRGRDALHMGRAGQTCNRTGRFGSADQFATVLHYGLPSVHGGGGDHCRRAALRHTPLLPPRHPHSRRHARSGDGRRDR